MREQVYKDRSTCNRKFVLKGDYPEDFLKLWGQRKVSDFASRKHAGFAVFQMMKQQLVEKEAKIRELETTIRAEEIRTCWEDREFQEATHYNWLDDENRRIEQHSMNLEIKLAEKDNQNNSLFRALKKIAFTESGNPIEMQRIAMRAVKEKEKTE